MNQGSLGGWRGLQGLVSQGSIDVLRVAQFRNSFGGFWFYYKIDGKTLCRNSGSLEEHLVTLCGPPSCIAPILLTFLHFGATPSSIAWLPSGHFPNGIASPLSEINADTDRLAFPVSDLSGFRFVAQSVRFLNVAVHVDIVDHSPCGTACTVCRQGFGTRSKKSMKKVAELFAQAMASDSARRFCCVRLVLCMPMLSRRVCTERVGVGRTF